MSTERERKVFERRDVYIKALRFIPLSPLNNNLGTTCHKYFPDGTTIERTVRDWAFTVLSTDLSEPAHCNVVNGFFDQKAYLLMAPQHEFALKASSEAYRSRIFPFRQREERFRESIGPLPSVIKVDSKVVANILFIEQTSASFEKWKQSDYAQPAATDEVSREDSILAIRRVRATISPIR